MYSSETVSCSVAAGDFVPGLEPFSSIAFFGNVLSRQTLTGTVIALAGTALYTFLTTYYKEKGNAEPKAA